MRLILSQLKAQVSSGRKRFYGIDPKRKKIVSIQMREVSQSSRKLLLVYRCSEVNERTLLNVSGNKIVKIVDRCTFEIRNGCF